MDKVYSISEVAETLGVSTSALRKWEETLGIAPTRSGPGQHRVYSQTEVDLLLRVRDFREKEGYTLDQMGKFLSAFSVKESAATSSNTLDVPVEADMMMSRDAIAQMINDAKQQIFHYVDEKIETIDRSVGDHIDKVVDKLEQRVGERDKHVMDSIRQMMEEKQKKKKSIWGRIFNAD